MLLYYCMIIKPGSEPYLIMHASTRRFRRRSGAHTFLALPKPFSRARVWASPSEPSCSWTRAWLVKMSSSPAADISTSALSSKSTTSLKNKRIVCVSLLRAVCEWTLSNGDRFSKARQDASLSSVIGAWVSVCVCGTQSACSASFNL